MHNEPRQNQPNNVLDSDPLRSGTNCMDRGGVKSEFVEPELSVLKAIMHSLHC